MTMKIGYAVILGMALMTLAPTRAHAGSMSGYVCASSHVTGVGGPGMGSAGYVWVQLYSQPNCGGSYVGADYVCSAGADNTTYCGSQLSEPALLALEHDLVIAGAQSQKVALYDGTRQYGVIYVTICSGNGC
jgi:hypothetical protein